MNNTWEEAEKYQLDKLHRHFHQRKRSRMQLSLGVQMWLELAIKIYTQAGGIIQGR